MAGRLVSALRGEGLRGCGGVSTASAAFSPAELVGRAGGVKEGCFCSTVVKERWWLLSGAGDLSRAGIVESSPGPNATRTDLLVRRGSLEPFVVAW
jgi:hypothetical protein